MLRLGVDIGGTKINVGVVDENLKVLKNQIFKTSEVKNVPELCLKFLNDFCLSAKIKKSEFGFCGIGVPGTVSIDGKRVIKVPNIDILDGITAKDFENALEIPCKILQDSRAAALAEYSVQAEKPNVFVCITLGTGIGTGIIINGNIFTGGLAAAGEVGHIKTANGTRICGCGKVGCVETYAAGKGLDKTATEILGKGKTAFDLFLTAKNGDEKCIKAIDDATDRLSEAVTAIINILSPNCIAFSGGLIGQKELFLEPLFKKIKEKCYFAEEKTELKIATLGSDAPMIGAAISGGI